MRLHEAKYTGCVVRITVGKEEFVATEQHPFWIIKGQDLQTRPAVEFLDSETVTSTARGRWVSARDLRSGDRLLTRSGRSVNIEGVVMMNRTLTVYNLLVDGLHNYAVGEIGILVHNKQDG